jgi:accessory colonization factor AcfC
VKRRNSISKVLTLLAAGIGVLAALKSASATESLHVYGPGGPLPAVREAAAVFAHEHGINIVVTSGPTPQWLAKARNDADVIFSGSEAMMSDFIVKMPAIDPASVKPLYLRPAAILVRPRNPRHIHGIRDLLQPGHRILVVNGAGQQGLWEDVAGRLGNIGSVRAFRANIVKVAANSAQARKAWIDDRSLDAWLIWTIWQVANPTLADQVAIEPAYAIYRDVDIALTKRGEASQDAKAFAAFLNTSRAAAIFAKWGWIVAGG